MTDYILEEMNKYDADEDDREDLNPICLVN